jgi:hypothetical protein
MKVWPQRRRFALLLDEDGIIILAGWKWKVMEYVL